MQENQEGVVTLTTKELLNFTAHHVTQDNLNETRKELYSKIESVCGEVRTLRVDLTKEIQTVRTEVQTVRTEVQTVRTDLTKEIQTVRTDLTKEIQMVRTEVQMVRTDLTKEIQMVQTEVQTVRTDLTKEINNMFYKLVILMMGTVGGLFGGMIYVLNNFYHLKP